jgi:putative copper export protein
MAVTSGVHAIIPPWQHQGVLDVDVDTVRVFLHVLAATIWVGGQLTLAALVPALRAQGREVSRVAARAFSRVAWPAFGVLLLTGGWNVAAESDEMNGSYQTTVIVKLAVVAVSGLTAYAHARSRSRRAIAVYGAFAGLSALAALFLGVMLGSEH